MVGWGFSAFGTFGMAPEDYVETVIGNLQIGGSLDNTFSTTNCACLQIVVPGATGGLKIGGSITVTGDTWRTDWNNDCVFVQGWFHSQCRIESDGRPARRLQRQQLALHRAQLERPAAGAAMGFWTDSTTS